MVNSTRLPEGQASLVGVGAGLARTRRFAEGVEFGRHMSPPRRSRNERKAAAMR